MNAIPAVDEFQELREAVRALCKSFDSAYWQKIDTARGYPEAFVDELTRAGWLAAMIRPNTAAPDSASRKRR